MNYLKDEQGSTGPEADLASRLRTAVVHLIRQIRLQKESGLSLTLHSALSTIACREKMSAGDLAAAEGLPPSAVTRIVDQLVAMGLVARIPNPRDRRGVNVAATTDGIRLLARERERGNAWLTERLGELSDGEREILAGAFDVLDKLTSGAGEATPRGCETKHGGDGDGRELPGRGAGRGADEPGQTELPQGGGRIQKRGSR